MMADLARRMPIPTRAEGGLAARYWVESRLGHIIKITASTPRPMPT